jgi:hypothetical protein
MGARRLDRLSARPGRASDDPPREDPAGDAPSAGGASSFLPGKFAPGESPNGIDAVDSTSTKSIPLRSGHFAWPAGATACFGIGNAHSSARRHAHEIPPPARGRGVPDMVDGVVILELPLRGARHQAENAEMKVAHAPDPLSAAPEWSIAVSRRALRSAGRSPSARRSNSAEAAPSLTCCAARSASS